ncbi:MAG: hypothetical protein WC965_01385 [Thiohalomonadaceae bacterium]
MNNLMSELHAWSELEPEYCSVTPNNVRVFVGNKYRYLRPRKLLSGLRYGVLFTAIEEAIHRRGWTWKMDVDETSFEYVSRAVISILTDKKKYAVTFMVYDYDRISVNAVEELTVAALVALVKCYLTALANEKVDT